MMQFRIILLLQPITKLYLVTIELKLRNDFRCFRSKMCFRTFSTVPLNSGNSPIENVTKGLAGDTSSSRNIFNSSKQHELIVILQWNILQIISFDHSKVIVTIVRMLKHYWSALFYRIDAQTGSPETVLVYIFTSCWSRNTLPHLIQCLAVATKQRRPRLVLAWVTVSENWALWTCVRSSVWTLICDRQFCRHHCADTDVRSNRIKHSAQTLNFFIFACFLLLAVSSLFIYPPNYPLNYPVGNKFILLLLTLLL